MVVVGPSLFNCIAIQPRSHTTLQQKKKKKRRRRRRRNLRADTHTHTHTEWTFDEAILSKGNRVGKAEIAYAEEL